MPRNLSDVVREYLRGVEGREVEIAQLRKELKIDPTSPAWDGIRVLMLRLANEHLVRPSGKRDGIYKVIKQVNPVRVFDPGRERRPPFELIFPRDFETMMEFPFAEFIVIRQGDLILISGVSNLGKTCLAINFNGENIGKKPVLLGNEYTSPDGEPTPRFMNRLESMDWVEWVDVDGNDKFTLLPVRDDYAEHIIKDRINTIDWINIETGEFYMIGTILDGIKRQVGKGVAIAVIQKAESATAGRGGQFTKDFADCELLIDRFSDTETLLTIGKVKEYTKPVIGKTFAFSISQGVKIINFREVKRCTACNGKGFKGNGQRCDECNGNKYV